MGAEPSLLCKVLTSQVFEVVRCCTLIFTNLINLSVVYADLDFRHERESAT